jgi:protein phosphatase 1 regulatory subunit 42
VRITVDVISRATTQRRRKEEEDKNFLRRLTHVNLTDKKIDAIQGLELCSNLQCLYLTDNRIQRIENLFFENLTHLYLQDNNISVMQNFEPLKNLRKLFIGGNDIELIQGLEACVRLEELHVQAQRLPPDQPLMFCQNSLHAIAESLLVLNAQKSNISQPSQFATLRSLERLDVSMNHISSFEEIGALFGDEACMNMNILEMRENPVSKQHKLRDYVALMSPTLSILDGREITQIERRFLVNREAAKARARNRQSAMNQMQAGGGGSLPPSGVEGLLLMESQGDYDPVEERRRARPHVDAIPRRGFGGGGEREVYSGDGAGPDRDAAKAALQARMQFEGDVPEVRVLEEEQAGPEGGQVEFDRVAREIEERREFLESMQQAGKGGEYEPMIKAQIAEKVHELEAIDRQLEGEAPG